MDISQNWLEKFRAVVAREIAAAGNKASHGYRAVEAKTGLGYDYIYQIYSGKPAHAPKLPTLEVMQKIAKAYPEQDTTQVLPKTVEPSLSPILSWEYEEDLPQGEYVFIPRLDIHLSAGNGREQVEMDFVKKQPQAFRADWIRLEKLNPSKLACMKVDGDSMESLLYHGETVVIDVSQQSVKDGKVYALWYDGGERVKRLWKLPGGGLRIKSDNVAHPTIEVAPEHAETVRILGRVVHKSGTGGL